MANSSYVTVGMIQHVRVSAAPWSFSYILHLPTLLQINLEIAFKRMGITQFCGA